MERLHEQVQKIQHGWKSQRIDVAGEHISSLDVTILIDVLASHQSIRSLGIRGCAMAESDIERLARSIKHSGLISIQLSAVGINDRGATAFATAVQESVVKRLDLSQNEIGQNGCERLADALKDCGLESLILCKNRIGPFGARYLAIVLKEIPTTLKVLDLSRNDIGDEGAKWLAWAMPSSKLTCLLMDTNGLTINGYKALCEGAIETPAMVEMVFSGNPMRGEMAFMDEIVRLLEFTKIEYLSLNLCAIDSRLLIRLAEGIQLSLTIKHIEMKGNLRLTDESMDEFMKTIGAHRALRNVELDLSGVTLTKQKAVQQRLKILHSNRSLVLQALVSTKVCPYLGSKSWIKALPKDLIRKLSEFLPEDGIPPGVVPQVVPVPVPQNPQPRGITVTQHLSVIPPPRFAPT